MKRNEVIQVFLTKEEKKKIQKKAEKKGLSLSSFARMRILE